MHQHLKRIELYVETYTIKFNYFRIDAYVKRNCVKCRNLYLFDHYHNYPMFPYSLDS